MDRFLAPAKINLFLHVTGKRADGYHLLESLVTFCDVVDELSLSLAKKIGFSCEGEWCNSIDPADNLCLRALDTVNQNQNASSSAHIHLTKNIPVAAGLGGGSADAAAVLRASIDLWGLNISETQLSGMALSLGADVPMCLAGCSAWIEGVGESIKQCSLPELFLVLVNPRLSCSTKDIFGKLHPKSYSQPLSAASTQKFDEAGSLIQFLIGQTRNDLTDTAQEIIPEIGVVLGAFSVQPACLLARMSGSGATCFGVFPSRRIAEEAARKLSSDYPQWWVRATQTISSH